MKLTLIFLTTAILQVSANSFAQTITLNKTNSSIDKLIKEVRQQSGYDFFYNLDLIKQAKPVSINVKNVSLKEALDKIFENQPLTYLITVSEKAVVVKEKLLDAKTSALADVKGRVTDESGKPLPGATVKVKGSNIQTSTNENGEFSLKNLESNAILVVLYLGFIDQEIAIEGKKEIVITLKADIKALTQVVVVGYGTTKKANLTGAVDQVGSEYFQDRPVPNTTRALQGVIPGLNITMTDGKPIRSSTYNIRGVTSIGAGGEAGALVLIDGVPSNPNDLNPNDIATVTVLKDAASAAIYGARGAFGVVLITTKTPQKGKIQLNYSSNFSLNQHTTRPDFVNDGYTWAKVFDEAYAGWFDYTERPANINGVYPFSQSYLAELKRRSEDPSLPKVELDASGNYVYYESTDWLKELYQDSNRSMEHALNVSGGSEKINFTLSGRAYSQDGIYRYSPDEYNRYNIRFKGDVKVNDWFSINSISDFSSYRYKYPLTSYGGKNAVLRLLAVNGFPIAPVFNPDGTLTRAGANTVGDFYYGKSYSLARNTFLRNTVGFTASILKDKLSLKGDFSYLFSSDVDNYKYIPVPFSNAPGVITRAGINDMTNNTNTRNYYVGNIYATFQERFKDHNLKVLAGYNLEYSKTASVNISRDGLLLEDLLDFNLASGSNYRLTGGGNIWAFSGVFSRINYDYKGRYLVEVNGRYDGSSKFPTNEQFGFFPSVSAGWRVSEENFMKNTKNWLDNFKLRASYGSLGNGNIDPYTFLQTIAATRSPVIINGGFPSYIRQPGVIPDNLTWETATTFDVGLDADFLKQRLSLVFDWYDRKTTGMIMASRPLPGVFGATVPKSNSADLSTKGWELSLAWRDQINFAKPLKYGVRVTLSDNVSHITKFYNPTGTLSSNFVGQRLGDIWGFTTEGLFQTMEEIAKHADQSYIRTSLANKLLPGDLKFKDLNGDGVVNRGQNTLADHGDVSVIGNSSPRYAYGVTADFSWNNFSFSAFFQGIGKRDWWPSVEAAYFWGPYNRPYTFLPTAINDNYWTPERPDAYYPRLRTYTSIGSTPQLAVQQTRYLQDASYIRLKDVTIGYTFPSDWSKKLKISSARLYVTGQNLWTWSPMYKITRDFDPEVIQGSDPEVNGGQGDGFSYPMLKTYTVGLNLTF
ncbi:TonB-dependent receptor [Pedobacter sp.]